MANVLIEESTLTAIADSIRAKTGRTEKILPADMATQISTITGGGSANKYIVTETTFPFVDAGGGIYAYTADNTYQLEEGKTYKVLWDGEEYEFVWNLYTVTVLDGQVVPIGHALGNPYFFNIYSGGATNFEDTGDPFMIGIASDNTFAILTNETDSTHTVSVYEGSTGGNSDDVRYVTFMSEDGSTELLVKPVAVGDDCADVIARGLISKPTKESTPQYNYTFTGWALSAGGSADNNALKSVTEDRVVYVAFNSILRYYTINYYDGDTLLKSESLGYGSTPDYTPKKSGYSFIGWEPALAKVTGNANYHSQWQEGLTFANASWEKIAELSEAGTASQYFALGDTKSITWTHPNGVEMTTDFQIVGFNHDDLADGTGKAGITLMSVPSIYVKGLSDKLLHISEFGTWDASPLRTDVCSKIYDALPDKVKSVIKTVSKQRLNNMFSKIITSEDAVWVPSAEEVDVNGINNNKAQGKLEGALYAYFDSVEKLKKYPQDNTGKVSTSHDYAILSSKDYSKTTNTYYLNPYVENGIQSMSYSENTQTYSVIGFCI